MAISTISGEANNDRITLRYASWYGSWYLSRCWKHDQKSTGDPVNAMQSCLWSRCPRPEEHSVSPFFNQKWHLLGGSNMVRALSAQPGSSSSYEPQRLPGKAEPQIFSGWLITQFFLGYRLSTHTQIIPNMTQYDIIWLYWRYQSSVLPLGSAKSPKWWSGDWATSGTTSNATETKKDLPRGQQILKLRLSRPKESP